MSISSKVEGWPPRWLTPVPAADVKRGDGQLYADFIEAVCRVTKDSVASPAGELLRLRPWQRTLLGDMLARRKDGKLRHRQALVGIARKNGKSAYSAGIALAGLVLGPEGGEVYSCAADRKQAGVVFDMARRMVSMDMELSQRLKPYRDVIENPATGSVYRALSSESFTKEGLNPSMTVFDEVHAQPNRELWDVMALAMGARPEPLMIGITTAGVRYDSTGGPSICYQLYDHGKRVATGEVDDPSFFMAWWEPKNPDADHRELETWAEGNPGLGDLVAVEDFESMIKRTPEAEFRALPLDTPILTTDGWKKIVDIQVGDRVYAQDGSPTEVEGKSGIFYGRQCYEVRGTDGRSLVADSEHWWPIETYNWGTNKREAKWVTTQWIYDNPSVTKYLLTNGPIDSPGKELAIDPYILGMWLGDGCAANPSITSSRGDVEHLVEQIAKAGYFSSVRAEPVGETCRVYVSASPIGRHGRASVLTFRGQLVTAGLLMCKHIPADYLEGSAVQRLALLQGLMDSDGTVAAGRARFTNKNKLLADGVLYLARSLGWKPVITEKANQYGPFYDVSWTAYRDRDLLPFRLPRKIAKLNLAPSARSCAERIKVQAVPVASQPTMCLAVKHTSRTFLAGESLVPTGNTKRCNQWVAAQTAWLPTGSWAKRAGAQPIEPGVEVVLGFDGSFNNDSTALVVCSVEQIPTVDVVQAWEKPAEAGHDWRVPILEVEQAIREACRRYTVREIVCDPYRWGRTYQILEDEGLPIVEYPQSPQRMVPATQRFYEAVLNAGVGHTGDPRLTRHLDNCVIKTDQRGSRITKETKSSPRKIDLAVAAVMAFDRAAVLAAQPAPKPRRAVFF